MSVPTGGVLALGLVVSDEAFYVDQQSETRTDTTEKIEAVFDRNREPRTMHR